MSEIKGCPWCGTEPKIFGKLVAQCINEFNCPNAYGRPIKLDEWQERPIEDALRAENAELLKQVAGLESALIGVEHVHMDNEELRAENAELREAAQDLFYVVQQTPGVPISPSLIKIKAMLFNR